jgi:predicted choloylglycine hydrolase
MSEAKQIYHVPVLLNESVDGMNNVGLRIGIAF